MAFKINIIYISIVITLIVLCLCADPGNCASGRPLPCNNQTMKHVDRIISKVNPLGNPEHTFPENIPDAMKHCKQLVKPIATLDDLNKRCMKGMAKEVVGIVLYSVKKKRRSMCKSRPTQELRELTESGRCVNVARLDIERCANRSLDRFIAMKEVADKDLMIPLVCCEIAIAKKCILDVMSKVDICQDRHQELLVGHFNGLSGGALRIACSEYNENTGDKCARLKSIKLNLKPGQARPRSIIMPVIELFESIGHK